MSITSLALAGVIIITPVILSYNEIVQKKVKMELSHI